MRIEQRWLAWMGFGGILLGIGLVVFRARSVGDAILDLQFRIPRDPLALFGNILIIASALSLVLLRLRWGKEA